LVEYSSQVVVADGKPSSRRRAHQRFDRMKTRLAKDLTDQQSPEQSLPKSGAVADRLPEPRDRAAVEDAASHSGTDDVGSVPSFLLFLLLLLLLPCQNEELRVGRQHFADGILKLTPGLNPAPYLIDPFFRDVLDLLFPLDHKGQRPHRMAAVLGAMTGRLAAAQMGEGEGSRESILGDVETAHELERALTQLRSARALGFLAHLTVYIQ
jgi:hypothetical protein